MKLALSTLKYLPYWGAAITLLLLPLQGLWLQDAFIPWQAHVLVIFGALVLFAIGWSLVGLLRAKHSFAGVDTLVLVFIGFVFLSFLWTEAPDNYLRGLRYSIFAPLLYFVGRASTLLTSETGFPWEKILKFSFYSVGVVAALQWLFWQIDAGQLLETLKLSMEHWAGEWPRLQGSLPGPNQLATFLMVASLWLFWRGYLSSWLLAAAAVLVVLTLSRSAILGLAVGLVVPYLVIQLPQGAKSKMAMLVVVAASLAIATVFLVEPLRRNFVEERHTAERLETWGQVKARFAAATPTELLIGHGPGTAGPGSLLHDDPFIPENWFLQIVYEYGIVGLGLILVTWGALLVFAYRNKSSPLVALILGVGVNSLFLHPLSDNTFTAMWFYLLLGLGYNLNNEKGTHRA